MQIGRNSFISPQAIIEQPENIAVGDHVQIKAGVVLRPETGFIVIGHHVVINHYTVIHAKGGVEIGDWCVIAPHCGLFAQNHSFDSLEVPITKQPNVGRGITLMGDNWLGAGAIILDGVTLGKGTVVGAGAVVTKPFPMAKVVAGNPARIIKDRVPQEKWDFHKSERCSVTGTPEEFWPYINQRAEFGKKYLKPMDVVLDLGCGEGYLTDIFRKTCRHIVGIDYDENAVRLAQERYGLECHHMVCTDLQFEAESFDKVTCFELLEHLTRLQAKKTVAEIHRVLKRGGLLIGSTPIRVTPDPAPSTYSHIYEYTAPELRVLLKSFSHIEICGDFFVAAKV
ncbi:MAG: methyltransferase domain-containing protein [Deltaproteobacteria bacterium]|nr:methyltransferase domain-containing protein [Deltaproteobacteria bacterium]